MEWAEGQAIAPVDAVVSPDNTRSIAILEKLGMVVLRQIRLPGADRDVLLFGPGGGTGGSP